MAGSQVIERRLPVSGPWSLAASARFWAGFTPAGHGAAWRQSTLQLAFCVDGSWDPVAATVTQDRDVAVIRVAGAAAVAESAVAESAVAESAVAESAVEQVARVLSLDVDGAGWPEVAERDPVVAQLQQQYPGLRPTGFYSPWEAAVWSLLSQRIGIVRAAAVKRRIAEQHGHVVEIDGTTMRAFPSPDRLVSVLDSLPIAERKRAYLAAVAGAARGGALDGRRLRSGDPQAAMAELQRLPGIGPFSAELIVVRGANHPDVMPRHETRLAQEMAEAYRRPDPSPEELADIASHWRPYRTWVAVHLRIRREERTHEIAGRTAHAPHSTGSACAD